MMSHSKGWPALILNSGLASKGLTETKTLAYMAAVLKVKNIV
jgi:hypothetical protein